MHSTPPRSPPVRAAVGEHPRLFLTSAELASLRDRRHAGDHALIWGNMRQSADWALTLPVREGWIAPVEPDPIYANLYDRFYAMMRDMAVAEHLAFAYAYSGEARYREGARQWLLALARVWIREADGVADAGKAYAVTRLLKGVAVGYDILYHDLTDAERAEVRQVLVEVGRKYYDFFADPRHGFGPGYEPHHGSVEAASFGLVALSLLDDVPEARAWLDLMVQKHEQWLLPSALTPSLTHNQTSNFWISIMQYRIAFMDALRRVTGKDLFQPYARFMDGRMALAALAGGNAPEDAYPQSNQSWLFGPSYGQVDYVSPVLLFLAREYRRPIYQHLARWDAQRGRISRSRYISTGGEQMLFGWGGYAYAWYGADVAVCVEPELPRAFCFVDRGPEAATDVNEAYLRHSYDLGGVSVGVRQGQLLVHAGGSPVLVEMGAGGEGVRWPDVAAQWRGNGGALIQAAPDQGGGGATRVLLSEDGVATISREGVEGLRFWCFGPLRSEGNHLRWESGAFLVVRRGSVKSVDQRGYTEDKVVGMGRLRLQDPMPTTYPVVELAADETGMVEIEVKVGEPQGD